MHFIVTIRQRTWTVVQASSRRVVGVCAACGQP